MNQSTKNSTVQEERLQTDANEFIDRAIAMLKESSKNEKLVAAYNGIVSLLGYAKESHKAAISKIAQPKECYEETKALMLSALESLGHNDNDYAVGEGNIRDACKELIEALQKIEKLYHADRSCDLPAQGYTEQECQQIGLDDYAAQIATEALKKHASQLYQRQEHYEEIEITSEKDLPTEEGEYFIIDTNGKMRTLYFFSKETSAKRWFIIVAKWLKQQSNPLPVLTDAEIEKRAEEIAREWDVYYYESGEINNSVLSALKAALNPKQ